MFSVYEPIVAGWILLHLSGCTHQLKIGPTGQLAVRCRPSADELVLKLKQGMTFEEVEEVCGKDNLQFTAGNLNWGVYAYRAPNPLDDECVLQFQAGEKGAGQQLKSWKLRSRMKLAAPPVQVDPL